MEATDDPLLRGPIDPPPGAYVNRQDQISPTEDPERTRDERNEPTGAIR